MSCLASQVFASGFAIQEQNVTNLGLAYSGTAALAEDASTGYYNPAGLVRLGESEIVLSGIIIQGDFDFTATSATSSFSPPVGGPVSGSNQDDPGTTNFVPTLHLSKRIDDRWVFGFSVTSPFGLNSEYREDGIARYTATRSSVKTIDISPSLAYEILPCLAAGLGLDAQYVRADLNTQVGGGVVGTDGFQKNHATGWGYGWHAGILWAAFDRTRVGLNYRSHINLHLEGNSENLVSNFQFGGAPLFPATAGVYHLQRVRANVTVPETWTLSLYQDFSERIAMTADVAWTNWSRFHNLRLRYEPGFSTAIDPRVGGVTAGLDTDTAEHFKDSRRYALGLIFKQCDTWTWKAGVAFDETPVRDTFRTARVPDSDRIWVALGAAYTYSPDLKVDFGYAHLFFDDASLNERAPFVAQTQTPISAASLAGNYSSSANIVGIQIRYDFV